MFKYELGQRVKNFKIPHIKGVITKRSNNLFGCNKYFIESNPHIWWVGEEDIITEDNEVIAHNKIKNIMDNFDFLKVHKVMTHLNWTWFGSPEVPTIKKLKELALRLLTEVSEANSASFIETGGFRAVKMENAESFCGYGLELNFIVEQWEE